MSTSLFFIWSDISPILNRGVSYVRNKLFKIYTDIIASFFVWIYNKNLYLFMFYFKMIISTDFKMILTTKYFTFHSFSRDWYKESNQEIITLPEQICLQLLSLLVQSTKMIPVSQRRNRQFYVSVMFIYLDIWKTCTLVHHLCYFMCPTLVSHLSRKYLNIQSFKVTKLS